MLVASNVCKSFGEMKVLDDVSMQFGEKEKHVIIGPNGAGKTTFVNIMTGVYTADKGSITLDSREISGKQPYKRARLGVNRTFQIPKPFADLTVFENVLVGAYFGSGMGKKESMELSDQMLELVGLYDKKYKRARELTSSQMKLLDLARALAGSPRYLFIDELGAGLSKSELDNVADLVRKINDRGVSVIYIGHIMSLVSKLGGIVTAFSDGRIIAQGDYASVVKNPEVLNVYLGENYA
ncbi:MAG: ABC transporter ATP-binding protein [Methanomassiliicoccales archaeon]|nr:ABC transporter ATP-binding protein [Methanomassiliicoccales archaeon]